MFLEGDMKGYGIALITAFGLGLVACRLLIPLLRKWKAGQNVLSYVKEHKSKGGTPTMGGLAFVFSALVACAIAGVSSSVAVAVCAIGLAFMAVGFLDDFLKCKRRENLGLRAWQKLALQAGIAFVAGVLVYRQGVTELYIPFTKEKIGLGIWVMPIAVFVFLATVNAVNLTDGLDGLAAGVSVPFFGGLALLIGMQNGDTDLGKIGVALTGALMAYLWFNTSPASVFMGDTGSLALGGFAAGIATFSGNTLYVPILGVTFVISVISVIIQVVYYKASGGKRVFLMSPVHHHFQQKGYSEGKISLAYATITLLVGALCLSMQI